MRYAYASERFYRGTNHVCRDPILVDHFACLIAMKLSDFIRQNIEPILDTWEKFAVDILSARHMNTEALRDHASGMLYAIAADLDRAQSPLEQLEKSKGRAPRTVQLTEAELHGADRVLGGFSVNDAMSEFRALRASVVRLWSESNPPESQAPCEELTRFHEAIDQALSESLARYATDKERNTRLFDTLLSSSPDLHCLLDVDGRFMYVNKSFAQFYEVSAHEIIGKSFFDIGSPKAAEFHQQLRQVVDSKMTYRAEMSRVLPLGQEVTYEYLAVPIIDEAGTVEAVAGIAHDITERKFADEKVRRAANYDFLTGLPNRSLFRDRLEHEVRRAARTGVPLALLFIDLDGFKEVNDRLGHDAGDQLLQETARRIRACVRGTDTVARMGGDEFTVILAEINNTTHVDILAQKILEELAKPFSIIEKDVHISGSIGITFFPQDAATPEGLVRNADQAMYVAKKAGRNSFSFFTIGMRNAAWARLKVIHALRHALPEHQFSVYYQPIVELSTERIVMAEALLRWHQPGGGLVLPGEFIGLAEEIGLIVEIGEWVLDQAVTRAREWVALLGMPFQVNVNKSPVEFMSKEPTRKWEAQLAICESARNCIGMEITEGVLLSDSPSIREKLVGLQQAGIQLTIDDFGTGYSTMSYLKKFKVDCLKIDQSFIHGTATNTDSRIFAETIIVMGHKLGLKIIAEGVETLEQRDWLRAAGCDYAQGYLFSKPVPEQEFESLLNKNKALQQPQA